MEFTSRISLRGSHKPGSQCSIHFVDLTIFESHMPSAETEANSSLVTADNQLLLFFQSVFLPPDDRIDRSGVMVDDLQNLIHPDLKM